jgi:hypothetical protein
MIASLFTLYSPLSTVWFHLLPGTLYRAFRKTPLSDRERSRG